MCTRSTSVRTFSDNFPKLALCALRLSCSHTYVRKHGKRLRPWSIVYESLGLDPNHRSLSSEQIEVKKKSRERVGFFFFSFL